jgi:hypothetical protein
VPLNIGDVEKIGLAWTETSSLQETDSLREFVWEAYEDNGTFEVKTLETWEWPVVLRVGAFTQTSEEHLNLERYGDAIMLD